MPRLLGVLLLLSALTGSLLLAQEPKKEPELTKEERAKLEAEAKSATEEGTKLYQAGRFPDAEARFRKVLEARRKLYPASKFPDGHPDLAESLNNLGLLLQAQNKFALAEPLYRDSLTMYQKLYPLARFPDGHDDYASCLTNLAVLLQKQGKYAAAVPFYRDALAMRQKLYPTARFPDGHPSLARSQTNLAHGLGYQGKYDQAEIQYRDAVAMYQKLYPPVRFPDGHPDLARSLNDLGLLLHAQGKIHAAESCFRDELALLQRIYPPGRFPNGHPDLARSLSNLGNMLLLQGKVTASESYFRNTLAMRQKLYPLQHFPEGDPKVASSLNDMAAMLHLQGKLAEAEPFARDALAMRRKLYSLQRFPDGHPDVARSLNSLASLLQVQGKYSQAELLCREALAMNQKLYPLARYRDGHPNLALNLNVLAILLQNQDRSAEAEPYQRAALAMNQKLFPPARFPQGHPDLARSIHYLAAILDSQGKLTEAEPFYREALAMRQQLYPPQHYPDGHTDLALNLNQLALILQSQGKLAQAAPLLCDALAMYRKLYPPMRYPDGHPDLARSIHHLGVLRRDQRQFAQAEPLLREALMMFQQLASTHTEVRGEGDNLTLMGSWPSTQHEYLSLVQEQSILAASAYDVLWASRSILTRLAEQKQLAVRVAALSPEQRRLGEEMTDLRRQRAQLLLAPRSRDPQVVTRRDQQLEEWDRKINDLAARMRADLPTLKAASHQGKNIPADLQKALPSDAVFLDLMQYSFSAFVAEKPGKEVLKRTLHYTAFLVTKDRIQHVDLGPAGPIEEVMRQWRRNTTTQNTPPDLKNPRTLRRLLWEPLEKHFPPGTATVYLCPDQQLCFLPWVALPGKKDDTVLLDDYTFAIVPHGPYLLGQLTGAREKEEKKNDLLVLGGVKYDDDPVQALPALERSNDDPKAAPVQTRTGRWGNLPGTAAEAEAVRKLAERRQLKTHLLAGNTASTERFKQELPRARIAHLATHGFFADPKFRSVFQMDEKLFAMRGNERIGAGALLPSLLSGLVFAGANRPETPGRGIVTAEELFDLDLTGMELAVLSACETGLGDVAGGEGVFGLQRAFHVAGCRNVIASLWKVDDVPTLVLMEEFYRNLWEKKLSKREALRQAQLTLYRNPDLVIRRAKEMNVRGIEDDAVPLPAPGAALALLKRSPPKWWAAFLLSGLGE